MRYKDLRQFAMLQQMDFPSRCSGWVASDNCANLENLWPHIADYDKSLNQKTVLLQAKY